MLAVCASLTQAVTKNAAHVSDMIGSSLTAPKTAIGEGCAAASAMQCRYASGLLYRARGPRD